MDISKSDVVISTAGRDRGGLFYVIKTEENFVFIADGKRRKIENPKRKKLTHVRKVTWNDSVVAQRLQAGDTVLNSELRRDLAACSQQFNSHNQGG